MNLQRKWVYTLSLLLVFSLFGNLYLMASLRRYQVDLSVVKASLQHELKPEKTEITESNVFVHVIGEVKEPGIYELSGSLRYFDAIEAAGGVTEQADTNKINLAAPLVDGTQVYVPSITSEGPSVAGASVIPVINESKININTASTVQLETLSGIGPSKAQAIVTYRINQGQFSDIEEIMNVSGIGIATFNKIKDEIVVR